MRLAAAVFLSVLFGLSAVARPATVILHGWDMLDVSPEEVLSHAEEFERTAADGVSLRIRKNAPDGRQLNSCRLYGSTNVWHWADVADYVPVFREIVRHRSLSCSMLNMWIVPKPHVDWRDDARWGLIAHNSAVVARVASEGGLKGLIIDEEDYGSAFQFFVGPDDPPFDEAAALARRRGAQVFSEVFRAFPNATLLFFRLLASDPDYRRADGDPGAIVKAKGHLWPAFVNGILDVMPPTAVLVDGNESAGYRGEASRGDYWKSACQQRSAALTMVAPENQAKYRAQMRAGFGLYIDAYTMTNTSSAFFRGPVEGSRLSHFEENLSQAILASDGLVWLYAEKSAWVPWKNVGCRRWQNATTWDHALPGVTEMVCGVKDAQAFVSRRAAELHAKGEFVELVKNGGFASTNKTGVVGFRPGEVPPPFHVWHHPKYRGGVGRYGLDTTVGEGDSTSLCFDGVGKCVLFCSPQLPTPATAGRHYGFRVSAKGAHVIVDAVWQLAGGETRSVPVHFAREDAEGWRHAAAALRVPESTVGIKLTVTATLQDHEKAFVDNVSVFSLEY